MDFRKGGVLRDNWSHIYSKEILEINAKDIIGDNKIDDIIYRYKWNDATSTSGIITDTDINSIVFTNYHKRELLKIMENVGTTIDPNSYMVCVSYSKNDEQKNRIYSDTQVGITGTGSDVYDMIREFEEEIGVTIDSDMIEETKTSGCWNYYVCKSKKMRLPKSYEDIIGLFRKEIYNKKRGSKVCGIITGTIDEIKEILDVNKSIVRRTASDIGNIYGFDLIKVSFVAEYLKWYYGNDKLVGQIRIKL